MQSTHKKTMCMNTQFYRRCDAAVIDDNAPSNIKHVSDAATAAVVASNGPEKKHDRRLKKNADKCRTKTGMFYFCIMPLYVLLHLPFSKTQ